MIPRTVYIGADHAGFALKEKVKRWLHQRDIPYQDLGNKVLKPTDDYPDYAVKVATAVVKDKRNTSLGLLTCGSAQGMGIAANKIRGIRAVVPFSLKEAQLSRQHNDANVLCLSGWFMKEKTALRMIQTFLATPFSQAARHRRRIQKIRKLEGRR